MSPTADLAFELSAAHVPEMQEPSTYELILDDAKGAPAAEASVAATHFGHGGEKKTTGVVDAITTGDGPLDRVVFLVPNWPRTRGGWIDAPGGRGGWAGRVVLEDLEWRVTLEPRGNIGAITDELRATSGYAVTHIGSAEQRNGGSFTVAKGREFLRALRFFMAFARGFWTPPILPLGFTDGAQTWSEWLAPTVSPWRSNVTWYDVRSPEMLPGAFPVFMERWRDPRWRKSLELAVSWLVEANPSDPAERSIVLAQVALELMGWLILVEDENVVTAKQWNAGRDKAVRNLRSLLQHVGLPLALPPERPELVSIAGRNAWSDGPEALVGFRNKLIHPRNRAGQIFATPVMARIELAEIASWYCDLVSLYFCGYTGDYLNRNTLEVEPVPWAL